MSDSGESIRVVHPLFQEEGGGSIPTSPLQLHVGEIHITRAIHLNAAWHSRLPKVERGNIERHRHSVCFGAEFDGIFYAAAIWSSPSARLLGGKNWLELRRFAISKDAPKNTASRMISIMVRLIKIKFPEIVRLISYQDTDVHTGTIYAAAGWHSDHKSTGGSWVRQRRDSVAPQAAGIKARWELNIERQADENSKPASLPVPPAARPAVVPGVSRPSGEVLADDPEWLVQIPIARYWD